MVTRSLAIRTRRADFGFAPSRSASSRRSGVLHLGEVADIVESVLYLERASSSPGAASTMAAAGQMLGRRRLLARRRCYCDTDSGSLITM
jgi:hypothetical protein